MKFRRAIVLYVAFPAILAVYNGIRGSVWLPELGAPKTILMFLTCGLPTWWLAQVCAHLLLGPARNLNLPGIVPLIGSTLMTVPASYFIVVLYAKLFSAYFPGIEGVLSPEGFGMIGGLWKYIQGPTGIIFLPLLAGVHYLYEAVTGDFAFFTRGAVGSLPPAPTLQSAPAVSTLFQKLRPELGRTILALEAQEHYIKVYTERGEDLILYRFGDAVNELADVAGLQVHRSYWVSRDAVTDVRPAGKAYRLTLRNGLKVPVSQSYRAALKQYGLLPGRCVAAPSSEPALMELSRAS